jgi:hypothetical protein
MSASARPGDGEGVAAVVISYNTREILRACLLSVVADAPAEVVVVDNGSTDGSVEMVRDEFPSIRLVLDPTNPGYGGAANRGVAACDAPLVLLLNSDTVLPRGTFAALRDYADRHPRAGCVGPRLLNPDGSLQPSCHAFPSTTFLALEYTSLRHVARRVPALRDRYFIDWAHDSARAVPWVSGAALLLRRTALDAVGGFDPSFHMYYEEVDLAYRMARAGWETHFAPVADITHLGGASTAQVWAAMRVRHFRSLVQFCARHHTPTAAARTAATLSLMLAGKLAVDATRRHLVRDPARRRELDGRVEHWRQLWRVPFVREAREQRAGSR